MLSTHTSSPARETAQLYTIRKSQMRKNPHERVRQQLHAIVPCWMYANRSSIYLNISAHAKVRSTRIRNAWIAALYGTDATHVPPHVWAAPDASLSSLMETPAYRNGPTLCDVAHTSAHSSQA